MTLREVEASSYELLRAQLIDTFLEQLGHDSPIEKIDALFSVVQPVSGALHMGPCTFNRDHLIRLDELRHDIMHRVGPRAAAKLQGQDLVFLGNTAMFLGKLVAETFQIELDDALIEKGMTNP